MATPDTMPLDQEQERSSVFLAGLTQDFASSLDINETLKHAIDRFMDYLDAEAASIFLLEEDESALVCRECAGPVDIRGLRLEPDQGIVGQTVQHNEAKIVRDVSRNPSFAAVVDEDTGFVTRSILCAPLSVRGRCLGALELLNKRSDDGLFEMNDMQLATTVAAAAALAIHNARMAAELVEQERVRKELELARQIQESLLPDEQAQRGLPVRGLNIPAREVSGDFYDYLPLGDRRLYFALADVSGKGMNAALLMAKTTSLLRCLAKQAGNPGELLARVNDELCETASMGMFVTIIAGYVDLETCGLELANGGHQPALIRRPDGTFETYGAQAPPLGVIAGTEFPVASASLAGSSMYLFTDGLSESVGRDGAQLDTSGLMQMIESARPRNGSASLNDIVALWQDSGFRTHDDITLMLVDCSQ